VSAQLQILQTTVHGILWKSLCLKLYKLQVVQRLTACDKQLRLQFLTHIYTQILEHNNLIHNTVFINEATFHISGHVSWHSCVVWGTEPLREHLEHERGRPKVNVWCVLMHGRVIVRFVFDEDIIKSN
jgi:hypothetical protein